MANRITRRRMNQELQAYNYHSYRKLFQSWDIHDYISYWSKPMAKKYYHRMKANQEIGLFPFLLTETETEKDFLEHHWYKFYKRK